LGRGIEDSPQAPRLGWRSPENPRKSLFNSGAHAKTQLLEFIPAKSHKGELSSAAVFSAFASM
jgi:hypothetical protein